MINKIEGKVICSRLDIAEDKAKKELDLLGFQVQYLCLKPYEVYHGNYGNKIVRSWLYEADVWRVKE